MTRLFRHAALPLLIFAVSGCADLTTDAGVTAALSRPSVAPLTQQTASTSLKVDASQIQPMYDRRMLAVDLPTIVRIATARNIDIKEAQQHVAASRGEYEASIGMIFPSLSPNITSLGLQGALSTPSGVALATFKHTFPAAVLEWVINPGQVAYELIASKRRLEASDQQDLAVVLETTRTAAVQYYDVVLAQAQVEVARRATQEAEELLRIERLRFMTGTGLPVDSLNAEAALAARQQTLLNALNGFYTASVALTITLNLDPSVMLVPKSGTLKEITLVRENLSIDEMLVTAVRYRPDAQAVRDQFAAAEADTGATIWGDLGPQVQATRTFAPSPPANNAVDTLYRQPVYHVTGGFNWSAATFGRIRTATANAKIAGLELDRKLDLLQAAVVTSHQTALTARKIIPFAQQEVTSAEEALRITLKNRETGTGLTLDVLITQDAANQARLHYATAVVRYNQAEVNLLAALGLIDQAQLSAIANGVKPSNSKALHRTR
jgi:outer membrane protein TolC